MNEQQLSLLFRYIDVTITAAIQHEIGGETKDLLDKQAILKSHLVESIADSQNNLCTLHKTKLQIEQNKIQDAELQRRREGHIKALLDYEDET